MVVTFRMWQLHVREVEQRAEEAERTRDEAARRRAMEERLRIARELHDSLTHSISVIQVQAGVAVHLARKRGEEVPPALLAIQEAGADAARELRATLGVLRTEEDGDGSGLCQLDRLVARARAAGLPVTVTVTGAQRPLPPEVDQAAYRIVQEALTNVSRHAGHARASVHLHYAPDALTVQVDDDGKGTGAAPAPGRRVPGLASSACGNGCPRSAAGCRPGRRMAAASRCAPNSPRGHRRDQDPAGRRPGADPQRHPGAARGGRRHRGGRRGRRRAAGGGAGRRAPPGHRACGHPDAGARRPRSHPADRRRRATGQRARGDPHQLRARRVHLRARCGRARAGSCSRTPSRPSCCRRCASSCAATRCCPPRSPAA